jgi:hypothetical protein
MWAIAMHITDGVRALLGHTPRIVPDDQRFITSWLMLDDAYQMLPVRSCLFEHV